MLPPRSYADQIVELHRVFKLKRILAAWRETRSYIDRFEDSFEKVLSLQEVDHPGKRGHNGGRKREKSLSTFGPTKKDQKSKDGGP